MEQINTPKAGGGGNLELFFPTCMGVFSSVLHEANPLPWSRYRSWLDTTRLRTVLQWEKGSPVPLYRHHERKMAAGVFFLPRKPFTSYRHWHIRKNVMSWIVRCLPSLILWGHATCQQIHASPSHFGKMSTNNHTWGELKKEGSGCVRRYINQITRRRRYEAGMCIVGHPLTSKAITNYTTN